MGVHPKPIRQLRGEQDGRWATAHRRLARGLSENFARRGGCSGRVHQYDGSGVRGGQPTQCFTWADPAIPRNDPGLSERGKVVVKMDDYVKTMLNDTPSSMDG